jgi:hypothetical protein
MPNGQSAFVPSDEEFPMTMQVGMVGTDGVLIASDTQRMNEIAWVPRITKKQSEVRHTFGSKKIIVSYAKQMAISSAKIMNTAERIANAIFSQLGDDEMAYPVRPIERIGAFAIEHLTDERRTAQCLIAIAFPLPARLYSFELEADLDLSGKAICKPVCREIESSVAAGDQVNPAVFWKERYYERQPVEKLIPLAAHLVVSANKLNKASIEGLEIIFCDTAGVHRLSRKSILELETQANRWDEQIGSFFSDYKQDFGVAPEDAE